MEPMTEEQSEELRARVLHNFQELKAQAENSAAIAELTEECNFLACRRSLRPSIADNRRMTEIFAELYELTGNNKYLL
jgi:acetyl-CoA carboxylase alpha subunit